MVDREPTRWSMIRRAAEGGATEREEFAIAYAPVIRSYLASRWRYTGLLGEIEDATQEVFLACFRAHGPLDRADPDRPGGFRAYLYGIVKNVACRFEERAGRRARRKARGPDLDELPADDPTLSQVFDRAWARTLVREAIRLHSERAKEADEDAVRRVELLRLRFREGLPIREIARRWSEDPARLHREYARGRREFAAALREVVGLDHPGSRAVIDAECARLVELLRRE